MDIKKLEANLKKEKENFDRYSAKARKSKERIESLEALIYTRRFSEVTDVVQQKGLRLDELMAAIKTGDLTSLQEKINQAEETQRVEEGSEDFDFSSNSQY